MTKASEIPATAAEWAVRVAHLRAMLADPIVPLVPIESAKYGLWIEAEEHTALTSRGCVIIVIGKSSFVHRDDLLRMMAAGPLLQPQPAPPAPIAAPVDRSPPPDPAAEFWTRKEVASYLRVSIDFVENSADLNRMIVRQGRKVLYRSRSVVQWASRKA